jgi:hypothetical protein
MRILKTSLYILLIAAMSRFACGQSPETLETPAPAVPRALVADFNRDGYPDFVLYNASTRQTAIWCLQNNVFLFGAGGPSLPAGWELRGVADFPNTNINDFGYPDFALFAPNTGQTKISFRIILPTLIIPTFTTPTVSTAQLFRLAGTL